MTAHPQYFDLQNNGCFGADFNRVGTTTADFDKACRELAVIGVEGILATIITEQRDIMEQLLAQIVKARSESPITHEIIKGIHIEGPFINEKTGYVGAHPVDAVRIANLDQMKRLLDAAGGLTRIVTLAPEKDPGMNVTKYLSDRKVIVSAGHCDPSLDQLKQGVDNGLSMFTHLGNGCPREMHRHDNIIQRALSIEELRVGFIADGVHIPYFALNNYLQSAGLNRSFFVTDSMAAAGLPPGDNYTLGKQRVTVDDRGVTRNFGDNDPTHFVASAATPKMIRDNAQRPLGLTDEQMNALMYRNPKKILGL